MREDFLHYLWKYKKFDFANAKTSEGEDLVLIDPGRHNHNAGPDFFNARLKIGGQLWAGNVEVHLKASDWYFHRHETDANYDNVILHVVWEDDIEIYRKDNSVIPGLALSRLTDKSLLNSYRKLLQAPQKWINCEKDFAKVPDFRLRHWQERLYFERLEKKSALIFSMLEKHKNDWEAVLFNLLAKNFGLNLNGDAFLSIAENIPFGVLQKCAKNPVQIEALFLGQAGLLDNIPKEAYPEKLKKEYRFIKHKFNLKNEAGIRPKFFRLRPDNFPNIRLSQLAMLYHKNQQLFLVLIRTNKLQSIYKVFDVATSQFWETHYSFKKVHKSRRKAISKKFKDLLVINTVVPLQFCYAKSQGKPATGLQELISDLPAETNAYVKKFNSLRPETASNAMHSQAVLHLKKEYCEKNKCLECEIGASLLG